MSHQVTLKNERNMMKIEDAENGIGWSAGWFK